MVMYSCYDFVHLAHAVSTESTWRETLRQLSQYGMSQFLRRFHHSTLIQLTWRLSVY
jgi:hypothetical protein